MSCKVFAGPGEDPAELGLAVQTEDRFRERALGDWPAGSFEAAVERSWEDMTASFPGDECNEAAQARAVEALDEVAAAGSSGHCLIGTYGNLLALILNAYDPTIDFQYWSGLTMPDVYQFEIFGHTEVKYNRLWMPDK